MIPWACFLVPTKSMVTAVGDGLGDPLAGVLEEL